VNKRLLFVGVSSMQNHAGQHKLYFLADAFSRQGIPVTILVPDLEENRAFFADKPDVMARFYPPGSAFGDAWRKARIVAEGRWSAIWLVGVGLRSFILRSPSVRHVPIIKDFDEFPSMIESFSPIRRTYLRWIERRMVAQAQGFTCASAHIEDTVRKQRPELGDRLLRMRVAISADEHDVDGALASRLREESAGRPIFLYVGSVNRFYEDQIDEIIRLSEVLHRRGSRARIVIAGGGPDLDYFKLKASNSAGGKMVEFAGHVRRHRDLPSYMDAASVLLFPFAANPFNLSRCPTKAFHYAAANRPVVTNKTGEVAALFGPSAFYYPERDVEAFADRCEDALYRSATYENGIPFDTLTWEARAKQFSEWLSRHGWLPGVPISNSHPVEA
jgi:glycosyltransferase involved in cell wall biosynthesis